MSLRIHFVIVLMSLLLLQNCGGGSDGGENANGDKGTSKNIEISILGLKELGGNELQIQYSNNDTLIIEKDQTIKLSNISAKGEDIKIVAQPNQQACILRTVSSEASSTLVINIRCGYRNEIRVTGIEQALAANNPLIVTRSVYYYENPHTEVSPFAVKSIFRNSDGFSTDAKGNPSSSYYTFLNSLPDNAIPSFVQDIRIVRQPNGYHCTSFKGALDLVQIVCIKDELPLPLYALAKKCIAIQASQETGFIKKDVDESLILANVDISEAEKFYVKPSRLGAFLLYDRDKQFLAYGSDLLIRETDPSTFTEWKIYNENLVNYVEGEPTIIQKQVLIPYFHDKRLKHDLSLSYKQLQDIHQNQSTYQISPETFNVIEVDSSECESFPEASLNATISPNFYVAKDPAEPVVGYADIHAHYGFPRAIGGMAMSGNIVHPYGIEHALKDCNKLHGNDGGNDLLGAQTGAGSTHDVSGYPDFTFWPNKGSITHVQAYYRWIERAYLSGLRLSVTLATGNPSFCQILQEMNPGQKIAGCSGLNAVQAQTDYIYEIQDYIDAQEGGPGEGWFRIVKTPQEARQVISQNKLAVVLGSEHSELFSCRERTNCTNALIDNRLADAIEQGLRVFFPVHRFDNAFAGTMLGGEVKNSWMNLTNHLSTSKAADLREIINYTLLAEDIGGHYWEVEECPVGVNGESNLYSMVDFKNNQLSLITGSLPSIFAGVVEGQLDPYLDYVGFREGEGGNACNIRGLHPAGEYLIQSLINEGLLVDVGHMSYKASIAALDIFEANNYSGVVSSHGWTEGSIGFNNRITNLGGVLGIFNATPTSFANTFDFHRNVTSSSAYLKSFALGSDIQGVTDQPGVDANPDIQINYPFTSLDGNVTFTPPQTGNRAFDFEAEGIAHYGLYAEWIEAFRQVDQVRGDNVLADFMNSAEAYIQMWERAEAHAALE